MPYRVDFLFFLFLTPVLFVVGLYMGYAILRGSLRSGLRGRERPVLRLGDSFRLVTEMEYERLRRNGWLEEL